MTQIVGYGQGADPIHKYICSVAGKKRNSDDCLIRQIKVGKVNYYLK